MPPARDDVDFAERRFPTPRQNAEALGDQKRGGAALGRNAELKRDLPLRPRRGLPAACAFGKTVTAPRHRRHPWSARARADRPRGASAAGERDLADRVFERHARERVAQHVVDVGVLRFGFLRRRHHDDDLAARLAAFRVIARQRSRDRRGGPPRAAW